MLFSISTFFFKCLLIFVFFFFLPIHVSKVFALPGLLLIKSDWFSQGLHVKSHDVFFFFFFFFFGLKLTFDNWSKFSHMFSSLKNLFLFFRWVQNSLFFESLFKV